MHPEIALAFFAVVVGMARWRDANDEIVREVVEMIRCALGGAHISHKEAAAAVRMDRALWARVLQQGGNLAALVSLAARNPKFSRELRVRLIDVLTKRDVKECEVVRSDSSAA